MSYKKDLKVEAQNYGLKHKLRQYVTPSGWQRAISEVGSDKYKERMETLREADDSMRETATLFKGYLKSAENAFKDNRYLDVAHWCAMINDGVKLMIKDSKPVTDLRDSEVAEYYTRHEDANPEHNYFSADDGLVATAGIFDRLFGNSIEKLYWKKIKESKMAVQSLINRTGKLVAMTYSSLDRMGNARAQGNIGAWIEDIQRIAKAQGEFQIFAKSVYDKHLKELADIVKSNKPAQNISQPINEQIPKANKAEEADDLVNESPEDEEELIFDLKNKKEPIKPVEEAKFDKGRPALTDPRSVKKQNEKELEEWSKVQDFLKGNQKNTEEKVEEPKVEEPKVESVKPIEQPKIESVKPLQEKVNIPEVKPEIKEESKVETSKVVEAPKPIVNQPIKQELPKPVEVPKIVEAPKVVEIPKAAPIPQIPQAPTQTTVEAPPKRGRGRPRKNPLPTAPAVTSMPISNEVPTQVSSNPFDSAPAVVPTAAPKSAPSQPTITTAPKTQPVHVDIKGTEPKTPESVDEKESSKEESSSISKEDAALNSSDKVLTLVMIPKIKPDNLDEIKESLQKKFGHPIRFVTKENGAGIAKMYKEDGWKLDAVTYDEAIKEVEAPKRNPLELLNDPKFLAELPTLSNGYFDKGRIIDVVKSPYDNGKMNTYPEFRNMDKATRKAVIDKLNELDDEKDRIKAEMANKTVSSPELSSKLPEVPKTEELKQSEPIINNEIKSENPTEELSEDEIEQEIFIHTGSIQKLLGKSMKDVTSTDIFKLLNLKEYLDSLPRLKNNNKLFNLDLIARFPEINILGPAAKIYFDTLKQLQAGKAAYPKEKVANVEELVIKRSHTLFFNELKKVAATQNKGLMAAIMCKYSEQIEEIDPEMSIKLLQQAEKLVD